MLMLCSATACEKLLEVERPIDRQVSAYVFSNDETARAAGLGMYGSLVKYAYGAFTGLYTSDLGMISDEIYSTSSSNEQALQFRENRLQPDNGGVSNIWATSYEVVYHVNLFLEKISRSEAVSTPLRNQLIGEGKFIRALLYFYLVNTYGNIPLITSADYHINGSLGQRTPEEVYTFMLADLEDAYALLTPDYLTSERIRANKWAAAALLARTYLYQGNWSKAGKYAQEVIASGAYALVSVDEVGLNSNAEAIFQLAQNITGGTNNYDASMLLEVSPSSKKPYYAVDSLLVKAFQEEDARNKSWIHEQITTNGDVYYMANKYKIRYGIPNEKKIEHLTILRLGELHLILAEALAQQEQLEEAITQLDIIRKRAGIPLLKNMNITKTKAHLLDLVMEERQRELCFELGHRWFDLNRTGRADAYFSSLSYKDWQPTDRYFPIPQSEILLNPFLKQNAGYK